MNDLAICSVERWLPERPIDIPAEQVVEYNGSAYTLRSRAAHDAIWGLINQNNCLQLINGNEELVDLVKVNAELWANADVHAQMVSILFREHGNPLRSKIETPSESFAYAAPFAPKRVLRFQQLKAEFSRREVEELIQALKTTLDANHADINNRLNEIEATLASTSSRLSMLFWSAIAIIAGTLVAIIEMQL